MELTHDGKVSITLYETIQAHSNAGHKHMALSDFYEMLSEPRIVGTSKDAKIYNGLFVSGKVNGHRKDENVVHKDIIIIDVDGTPPGYDLYSEVADRFKNAFAIYSTYSHTAQAGRYRLLIPVNRHLTPKQYEHFTNYAIKHLNIPGVDASTDQASRSFALPVVKDAKAQDDYIFTYQDAPVVEITDRHLEALAKQAEKEVITLDTSYKRIEGAQWNEILQPKAEGEGRNEAMVRLAGSLLRRYVDTEVAYYLLRLWNDHHHQPMDNEEFDKTFSSILKSEMQRRTAREMRWNDDIHNA